MGNFFSYKCTANLPLNLTFTEFWKSVKIWQSYCKENGDILFWNTVYYVDKGGFWCYSSAQNSTFYQFKQLQLSILPAHACVYSRHEQQYIKMSPPLLKIANIYQLIVWIRSVLKRDLIGNLILRPTQIPVSEWSLVMFHWPVTSPLCGHSYHGALVACKPRVRGLGFSNTASNVKFTNLME